MISLTVLVLFCLTAGNNTKATIAITVTYVFHSFSVTVQSTVHFLINLFYKYLLETALCYL